MKGKLVLENGAVFEGKLIGDTKVTYGEVVFNTGMTGYQEVLTDPSYAGQIVIMTYPLIGNYGINVDDHESYRSHVAGFIIGEMCPTPSNFRSSFTVDEYLKSQGVVGLSDIDTRQLVRMIRENGTMKGYIIPNSQYGVVTVNGLDYPELPKDLVARVTRKNRATFEPANVKNPTHHIVIYDFGQKQNMVRALHALGCKVTIVPYFTTLDEVMKLNPDGILFSNGPGDPMDLVDITPELRKVAEAYPTMGICYGHQMLGLAFGAKTTKLRYGHRGSNHPVKDLRTGKVYITSQNHGYIVEPDSLAATDMVVTHINVNDGTVEGIQHKSLPIFSVQYHPEACPGPKDSLYFFQDFIMTINEHKERTRELVCPK
ncbi:carbamoyl phosphate synthase small subunit [Desulfuribacillus stibiiarsenatis]|uniref:Carbamoyl phosphate synthase small chain n=1 Tax=Desulfuribacillus stibiiarsenatis TaxID=1390249 RepID=A0A1E5L9F6_9FIRM|nr:glutamine-hydrolyzing carbamoyl-phosphate synthase small subunit [Desulfuribacillus stibiiarsenatis]OEH86785.1 carbamoyl phosphate synthase small subunit [Desulfuribacillus stibiiarsenatis]